MKDISINPLWIFVAIAPLAALWALNALGLDVAYTLESWAASAVLLGLATFLTRPGELSPRINVNLPVEFLEALQGVELTPEPTQESEQA